MYTIVIVRQVNREMMSFSDEIAGNEAEIAEPGLMGRVSCAVSESVNA
ncbi:hypothetical protein ACYFX5_21500 [Bremerella sp. T1]|nr:hypothetical protein [Bremerella volcania]UBM35619.1 hypothetical protein LA756_23440 [Bremerella volcania]